LGSDVRFHLSISIVDDSQEHVEQDEEDEEHVADEEGGSKNTVGIFDLVEVKVTEDDTEESEAVMKKETDRILKPL
jgi:hypothetical protein